MVNRFCILSSLIDQESINKSYNHRKKTPEKTPEKPFNIFKQNKPPTQNKEQTQNKPPTQNKQQTQNKPPTQNNLFKKQSKLLTKTQYNFSSESFPELNTNTTEIQDDTSNKYNYLEKIKVTKIILEEKKQIQFGWTNLQNLKTNYYSSKITISNYYNPNLAREILYNRQNDRDEINNILGDISPYWNTILYDNDDDEDHDDYCNYDSDKSDEYYDDYY